MSEHHQSKDNPLHRVTEGPLFQPIICRLVASTATSEIMVECPGYGPKAARLLAGINRHELLKKENDGREVLVVFAHGNPEEPVIIGMFENVLEDLVCMKNDPHETLIDGDRVVIQADREIVLACGEGSITIKEDGKIIVKGKNILSRASQTNKVKGGSVELN